MYILIVILFCWLLLKTLSLAFRVSWGLGKVIASILFTIAVPLLVGCVMFAGGLLLLVPLAMIAIAFGLLKICI